jgi:hypothetical protein
MKGRDKVLKYVCVRTRQLSLTTSHVALAMCLSSSGFDFFIYQMQWLSCFSLEHVTIE